MHGLVEPRGNSYESSCLDALHRPNHSSLSLLIFELDARLNIGIRWTPRDHRPVHPFPPPTLLAHPPIPRFSPSD